MTGRKFAHAGVIVGLGVSIWANVAQTMTHGAGAGSLLMAGFWPLGLYLALEILARVKWTGGRTILVARLGVGLVAAVAAVVSYQHLHALLLHYGEGRVSALVGPLAIDGLMAVSAAALLVVEVEPVAQEAAATVQEPVTEPVPAPVPAEVEQPVQARPVAARKAAQRKAPARARQVSDADLLVKVAEAVTAGEIAPDEVTGNRLRALLGVGAERSTRLAEQWTAQHVVRPLRAAVDA